MKRLELKKVFKNSGEYAGKTVYVCGWARTIRDSKSFGFIELNDGRIVTGKTGNLLGASSACLLNALKTLAGIDDEINLLSPTVIEPIQELKTKQMGSANPRLHTDEVLIALAICATTDNNVKKALEKVSELKNCELHSTVMLSYVDEKVFKKLGLHCTYEPKKQTAGIYIT